MKSQTFSGIEVLGNMSWGTHFCQFYDTKKDLLGILVPYFKTGLENNEFCLWIASDPIDVKEAAHALKKATPGFDRYIAEQKIEILSHVDWYLKGGRFDPKRVFNGWNKKLNQALERDYTGMRVSGNVGWIENRVGKDFIKYEKGLDRFLSKKRMIVLCTYPLKKTQAKDVLNVAVVHDCAISTRNGRWEILEIPENKNTKAQIQRENEELEQRVKERTIQLDTTNKQLRKLSAHLQNIQENERTAIAREIHDELGQQLTALKMDVGWLNKKLRDDITLKEKVNEILSLISEILKTVKRIAFELRPNILDNLGLIAALKWQGKEFEKRTGIKSQFHTDLKDFIPERNLSTIIFRVYQEALTNVARHAQATRIETTLEKKEGYIRLIVKDNGQGFDVDEAKNKNSLGLIGMNERALMLQGELTIKSKKLKGTVVTLKIPLPETDKKES
jgi:signal transduction histidine kinase